MRKAEKTRRTTETEISLTLELDGSGTYCIDTGVGFLDHMLELFAKHGGFDLSVQCSGDTHVDGHHTVEDTGIVLGGAFGEALGDRRGIRRYGSVILPMDEALILAAVDLGGRAYLGFDAEFPAQMIGAFDTELVCEFMAAFTRQLGCSLHLRKLAGTNGHHIAEGIFKALARAMREAVEIDARGSDAIPSTKGIIG